MVAREINLSSEWSLYAEISRMNETEPFVGYILCIRNEGSLVLKLARSTQGVVEETVITGNVRLGIFLSSFVLYILFYIDVSL